jgi:hypothetical protein
MHINVVIVRAKLTDLFNLYDFVVQHSKFGMKLVCAPQLVLTDFHGWLHNGESRDAECFRYFMFQKTVVMSLIRLNIGHIIFD